MNNYDLEGLLMQVIRNQEKRGKIYMRFLRKQQKTFMDKRALRRMPAKVTKIEVKPGNLGTKYGWSIPVNVRVVPVKHIEVKYLP